MADFSGVTFAKQNVTPADDGLIRRALLSDGILTGCNFSYSGYTLSMRAGALIVCGRQIRHPSAQNWAVVGAKSGYARLVLDIDLTKSSTNDLFEQVSTTLEYATDEAGFTELIQEDLNVSGSHYQIALCVVSLGEAGITGIVSQLDSAAGTGGNFSVVGGLTQPTSPKENMIWVKADVKKAPKYVFAVAAPESPSDGLIWFQATNAGIITQTNVYAGGAWVAADTYMYLGGKWVQIASAWNGELFDNGNQYTPVTGGWVGNNQTEIGTTLTLKVANSRPIVSTQKAIDLTGFTKLHCIADRAFGKFGVTDIKAVADNEPNWVASAGIGTSDTVLDISAIESGYIQCFAVASYGVTINVTKMWLT